MLYQSDYVREIRINSHLLITAWLPLVIRTRAKIPPPGLCRIEQSSSRRSPLISLGIGEDPNRKNHHVESGKLKLLLQRCGRVIV
jgi:hypothetical protein